MSEPEPGAGEKLPIGDALGNPQEAPALAEPGDGAPERKHKERPPFPPGSPVRCLGNYQDMTDQQKCFYLNWNGQLVGLDMATKHGKNSLAGLYGVTSNFLEENWPQWSKPIYEGRGKDRVCIQESEIVGFDQADASRAHIEECCRQGVFNPTGRLRGPGAHELRPGKGLVLHCGDRLCVSDLDLEGNLRTFKWQEPGLLENMVYVAEPPIPRPWHERCYPHIAEKLLRVLSTWNFRRPLLDPRFALGAIGLSPFGGAAPWRSHIWITGDKGTGKSTLNGKGGLIHQILGEGVFRTGNASAAAIRQNLRNSTVPVMFDEIEATAHNERVLEVVELARVASSGDTISRGGADHNAREFTLQSCFWFSSVLIPPLRPTDRSRLAILELEALDKGAKAPDLAALRLPDMGRQLMRRMCDGWHRLAATKAKYHAALQAKGHDNRACDQFGTLLASADILLNDWDTKDGLPDDEDVAYWAGLCRPDRMAEISDTVPDHVSCLHHLITSQVQARGGDEREALGTWIGRAVNGVAAAVEADFDAGQRASKRMQEFGVRVVNARFYPAEGDKAAKWGALVFEDDLPGFLAVSQSHQALARIFDGTTWQAGVWAQSLKRVPGSLEGVTLKFGKVAMRAILVPISAVLDDDDLPKMSRAEVATEWRASQEQGPPA